MTENRPLCPDDETLRSLLAGGLTGSPEAECRTHLDVCAACCERLERLAGGSRWVPREAALAGSPKLSPGALDVASAARATTPGGGKETSKTNADDVLDLLEPGQTPGSLGRIGDHEVVRVCGRGGMGVVLEARDVRLERRVAIKVLAPILATSASFRQRFAREARAAAAIRHPNVITVHAVLEGPKELPYIVMEYVEGETLEERLDRQGRLSPEQVAAVGLDVARGLSAAHAVGLIHRDIKPSNILLDAVDGRAKIADFGVARDPSDANLTATGQLIGTPHFMAPEQAEGRELEPRADLFSLGAVLYAASTGRRPFEGGTAVAVLKSVVDETPAAPRAVDHAIPRWLSDVIVRLLAKEPSDRFASAYEVAAALEAGSAGTRHARVRTWLPRVLSAAAACSIVGVALWLGLGEPHHGGRAPAGSPAPDRPVAAAPERAAEAWPDSAAPFAVLDRDGRAVTEAASLPEAIANAPAGATVEIRADGPFTIEPVFLRAKPIRIRAGPRHRPALVADVRWPALFLTDTTIVLEGLDIYDVVGSDALEPSRQVEWNLDPARTVPSFVGVYEGELLVSHCRFRCAGHPRQLIALVRSRCTLQSSELYGRSAAILVDEAGAGSPHRSVLSLDNCVLAAGVLFKLTRRYHEDNELTIRRCTLRCGPLLVVHRALSPPSVHMVDSILGASAILHVITTRDRTAAPARHIRWNGTGNIYDVQSFVRQGSSDVQDEQALTRTYPEWRAVCGESDSEALVCRVRFRLPLEDMRNRALKLTPDLSGVVGLTSLDGTEVDPSRAEGKGMDPGRTGPGDSYHRWRASEDYASWEKTVREVLGREE